LLASRCDQRMGLEVAGMRLRRGERRLLLIPFAPGIGDVVMMEPLLRAVCQRLPDWEVTMVARPSALELLRPGGYRLATPSYFVTEPPAPLRPLDGVVPRRVIAWCAGPGMAALLGPFERVINLFWIWESRVPFDRWWTPQWPPLEEVRHTVDLLADYLEGELGSSIPARERVPRLEPFPDAVAWARSYLRSSGAGRRPMVSMVVAAANPLKWWSVSGWSGLNDSLQAMGFETVMIAPRDHPHAMEVYRSCRARPLWPHIELKQVSALLAQSRLVVGIDTGPLHMAAALGVPWVGLFGASNPGLIGPYDGDGGVALVARFSRPESCARCWLSFKNRERPCSTLPLTGCTASIPYADVIRAVESTLEGTSFASRPAPRSRDRR